jgi:hypothetical protein
MALETAREAVEKGEELVAVGLRKGLEVIEDEQHVGITEGRPLPSLEAVL